MLMTIVYGIYSIFFTSPSKTGFESLEKGSENSIEFVIDAAQNIAEEDFSETNTYIIARASAEWLREPFLKSESPLKSEVVSDHAEASAQEVNFIYSGYIEMVDKRLAIINGLEYEAGEVLDRTEYIVRSIFPTGVVIGLVGEKNNIFLPLEETDTPPFEKTGRQK